MSYTENEARVLTGHVLARFWKILNYARARRPRSFTFCFYPWEAVKAWSISA